MGKKLFEKENREKKVDEIINLVKSRFENGEYGSARNFNDDIPLQLTTYLDDDIFDKLLKAQNLKGKSLDEWKDIIFESILCEWDGFNVENIKKSLEDKMVIAAIASKDALMRWYIDFFSEHLHFQAR